MSEDFKLYLLVKSYMAATGASFSESMNTDIRTINRHLAYNNIENEIKAMHDKNKGNS